MQVLDQRIAAIAPSRPRTARIDSSRSNGTKPSRMQRRGAERAHAAPRRRPASRGRAAPCRRSRAAGSSAPRAARSATTAASRLSTRRRRRRTRAVGIPSSPEERLLAQAVLRDLERVGRREDRHPLRQRSRRLDRDVLELVGHDVDARRELGRARRSSSAAPRAARRARHERFAARDRGRRSRWPSGSPASASMRPSWPPPRTPTLTRSSSGSGIGEDGRRLLGRDSARSASRIAGCLAPRIAAASSAALIAPARPIASVPTGTPAGICTIESSESTPLSAADSTGTPSTGRSVFAAVIPGRCAAPPGAGDDHLEAARLGACRRTRRAGRACDAPTRPAPRAARRAPRASRRRAAWSPSRTGSP